MVDSPFRFLWLSSNPCCTCNTYDCNQFCAVQSVSIQSSTPVSLSIVMNYGHFFVIRVHTGQGKLEKVREFEWSGKVRENAKVTGKSGKFGGKILPFCTAVVMLIIVELEYNPPYC